MLLIGRRLANKSYPLTYMQVNFGDYALRCSSGAARRQQKRVTIITLFNKIV
jgi:hypothetical protein